MQPTTNDSSTVDATIPTGNDAYVTDSSAPVTAPAPVSSAMSDALAATAAASATTPDPSTPPAAPLTPPSSDAPIFGPTPASEALANDPLSPSNNSTAPAVAVPTSEQAINNSVDAITAEPAPSNQPTVPAGAPPVDYSASTTAQIDNDSLLAMKQDALEQLTPLVGHLDQSPEEKFKTTMMMLQATDNPALVKEAYEYAKQISDEKSRAQALLDVVNEINYFTHQQTQTDQPQVF